MSGVRVYCVSDLYHSMQPSAFVVRAEDYSATQSELAALREELSKTREAAKEELDGVKYTRRKFRQERDDLQQRLADAERRNSELQKDKDRLDALESNFWDVRHNSYPIADTGDSSSSLEIIGHWMDEPFERVIGENYNEDLRAAIDQAMNAPAYPPERPEYPEIDELLDKPTESGTSE